METYQAKCMNEAQKGNSMTELEYYKTREKMLERELNEANDEINRLNFLAAQESDKSHSLKCQLTEILRLSEINQEQQDEIDRLHEDIKEFSEYVYFLQGALDQNSDDRDCYIEQITTLQRDLSNLSKRYEVERREHFATVNKLVKLERILGDIILEKHEEIHDLKKEN